MQRGLASSSITPRPTCHSSLQCPSHPGALVTTGLALDLALSTGLLWPMAMAMVCLLLSHRPLSITELLSISSSLSRCRYPSRGRRVTMPRPSLFQLLWSLLHPLLPWVGGSTNRMEEQHLPLGGQTVTVPPPPQHLFLTETQHGLSVLVVLDGSSSQTSTRAMGVTTRLTTRDRRRTQRGELTVM